MAEYKISDIVTAKGIFSDGDWVESKDQDPNGEVRLIQLADIGDGYFINKSNRFLTKKKALELNCTFLKKGDILMARMPDPIGRVCIFPGLNQEAVTVVDVCIIRPSNPDVFVPYLKYHINSLFFRHQINKHVTGTTRKRISRGNLNKIVFTLPSLTDQKRIAKILSHCEQLIQKRKQSINLLDEFLKSTFLEMFRDSFSHQLSILDEVCNKITDGTHHMPKPIDDGIPILRALNVNNNSLWLEDLKYISESEFNKIQERSPLEKGDVLLTCLGSIGRVAVFNLDERYTLVRNIALLKPNKELLNPHYLSYCLQTTFLQNQIRKYIKKSSQEAIYLSEIKRLKIPIPDYLVQIKFASIVEKTESIKTPYQQSLQELENLFGSLSQKAFKGELDLDKTQIDNIEETLSQESIDTKEIISSVEQTTELSASLIPKLDIPDQDMITTLNTDEIDEQEALKKSVLESQTDIIDDLQQEVQKAYKIIDGNNLFSDHSTQAIAELIKKKYTGYHFNIEMLIRFLKEEENITADYHASSEIKKSPSLYSKDDIKKFVFSATCINGEKVDNPFIKLKQEFYNSEEENFVLNLTSEDYKMISADERSGVYLSIINED